MADEELGVALIVIGVVLMIAGFIIPLICGVGIILLIVGIILLVTAQSRSPQLVAPGYGYPGAPPYGYPAQPPAAGAPVAPAPYTQPPCPMCGSPLSWIPQYGRWYCYRCQAYR
jgi:hypothetical protein